MVRVEGGVPKPPEVSYRAQTFVTNFDVTDLVPLLIRSERKLSGLSAF